METRHLLLAITVRDGALLAAQGVALEAIERRLRDRTGDEEEAPADGGRFSVEAETALAVARREARRRGRKVEIVHLLLGLACSPQSLAGRLLAVHDVTEHRLLSNDREDRAETSGDGPRAYVRPEESVPARTPILMAMGAETAAGMAVIWLAVGGVLRPVDVALAAAVLATVSTSVNDRLCPPRPGPAPPGPAGFYLKYFRRGLSGGAAIATGWLIWAQFGPVVAAVVGLAALSGMAWLGYRLRRVLGGRMRLRDTPAMATTSIHLLRQALAAARSGEVGAAQELAERIGDDPRYAIFPGAVHALALQRAEWAGAQGDLDAAERYLTDAVAYHRSRKRPDRSAAAETIAALGRLLVVRERYEEARSHLKLATEVAGWRMYRQTKVQIEYNLAIIAIQTDDPAAAREHAQEARRLAAQWGAHDYHAQACDLLALLAADEGRTDEALALADEAGTALTRDSRQPHAEVLHAMRRALVLQAAGRTRAAMDEYLSMMDGLADLRRGWGWRDAQDYLVRGFGEPERRAFQLAMELFEEGDPHGAASFARLIEFAERTSLRQMLLAGLAEIGHGGDVDGEVVRLLGEIADYEGTTDDGVGSGGERPDLAARQKRDTRAYERLEALVSQRFRTVMESSAAAPPAALRTAATGTHVLQVRLLDDDTDEVTVAGLWTSPEGVQHPFLHTATKMQRVMLRNLVGNVKVQDPQGEDRGLPPKYRAQVSDWKETYRYLHLITPARRPWARLAALLLPPGLLELLADSDTRGEVPRLLVVPDPALWRLPWAAMVVAPEDDPEPYLIDRAVLTLLPSLFLIEETPARSVERSFSGTRCAAYFCDVDPSGLAIEQQALDDAFHDRFRALSTPAELIAALDAPDPDEPIAFLALSVHGTNRPGLAHSLFLDRRTELSAARMLTLRVPPLLMINACMSAELDQRRGTDPLGIPTVALCRGAHTVIGGIFPLPDGASEETPEFSHPTASILSRLYHRLSEGWEPAEALRDAQRNWLADRPGAVPLLWSGLVAISAFIGPRAGGGEDRDEPRAPIG
ncbi:CHAT domain-containing protein [Thermomonospora cellulosilytica]|uniref:CHAT domain-containing protein n=1 Tax=Thermomonospora cellulosilytica TaxID=1411118 RepID=A0A7W3N0L6_9ACTN|nr:CHAT domain-containing protein [Thermomonospora cellulosilytica]MBA9005331.1 hypothetical protein [Thermomonospora cellulosilytica]